MPSSDEILPLNHHLDLSSLHQIPDSHSCHDLHDHPFTDGSDIDPIPIIDISGGVFHATGHGVPPSHTSRGEKVEEGFPPFNNLDHSPSGRRRRRRRMATESDGEEEATAATAGKLTGSERLTVEDDLREMAKKAAWSVSSSKPGNGVVCIRDDNLETYWQSDGAQPHLVNIQFQKKVKLQLLVLYVDFKLDESYTPSKISIRAGDGFHNLKEIKTVELVKPVGWVHISLSGPDPRETFIHTFMLQLGVLSNHLNGRDTHIRQIKVYGPRPNPVPHQPFHFTSPEFITYSTIR